MDIDGHDRVLLVTAHPDDEAMFFTPSLLALQARLADFGRQVHLMCFTPGVLAETQTRRAEELKRCCREVFGMHGNNVTVVDRPEFRDGPVYLWDISLMTKMLLQYCQANQISWLLTFDFDGISSHPNHRACWRACVETMTLSCEQSAANAALTLKGAYQLTTLPLPFKYTSFLGALAWCALRRLMQPRKSRTMQHLFNPAGHKVMYQAMKCHESQFVWFRYLFLLFSTYAIFNEITPIDFRSIHII